MKILFLLLIPVATFGQFTYHQSLGDILVYNDENLKLLEDTIKLNEVFLGIKTNDKNKTVYIMFDDANIGYIKYDINFKDISKNEYTIQKEAYIKERDQKILAEKEMKRISVENRKKVVLDSIVILEQKIRKKLPANKITLISSKIEYDGSFAGASFIFYPTFQKDLKYIEFVCQGFNRVGDPETEKKTLKLIGPITNNSMLSHTFDNVFYSDFLEELKVSKIIVTKFDNTKITLLPIDFTLKDKNLIMDYSKKLTLEIEYYTIIQND